MTRRYDYEHVVTFDETNVVGNVYFVNHLRWQGHCRELFLARAGRACRAELAESLVLVTTRCSCEYFAELVAFDRVQVRMSLAELGQSRVLMRFDYFRVGDGAPDSSRAASSRSRASSAQPTGFAPWLCPTSCGWRSHRTNPS